MLSFFEGLLELNSCPVSRYCNERGKDWGGANIGARGCSGYEHFKIFFIGQFHSCGDKNIAGRV